VSLGGFTPGVHSMIGGSLLTLVGYQIASLGVFATVATDPIRKPEDKVTTWLTENLRLEQGATFGTVLFGVGSAYGLVLFSRWASSGFSQLPVLMADVIAFTAIVLGIQIVFGSFFLSAVAE